MDNLEEMHRFLEKFILPRLNQEEIQIMNNPITITEIETDFKNLPKTKAQDQMASQDNSIKQTFRDELMCYEATITLISKPDKNNTQKENYRSISRMNIDAKTSTTCYQTEFKNTLESSYAMIKLGLFQGCKDSSISVNQSM